jgi:hypothetical protein
MTFDVAIPGEGLFACGDSARDTGTVAFPVAEHAMAGTAVDASLTFRH